MTIKVVRPENKLVEDLRIRSWPVWGSPVTEFDWHYDDNETCLFLEGEVEVTGPDQKIRISAGDLVVFPKGLSCRWNVLKPVKKHYSFGAVPECLK